MTGAPETGGGAPLFVVRGDASAEEVAALVAVLHAVAAARSAAARPGPRLVREWSAPRRLVRGVPPTPGPGVWRASALPR